MNETEKVSLIIENYQDKERLSLILKLHKEGHITEDEALNLLQRDRNYYMAEAIRNAKKELRLYDPYPYNIPGWVPPLYGNTTSSITYTGNSLYTNSATNGS